MRLEDIKYGDILVAKYYVDALWTHNKNYIIFIAASPNLIRTISNNNEYKISLIPTLCNINLNDELCIKRDKEDDNSIGFCEKYVNTNKCYHTEIMKPTPSQYMELMNRLKNNRLKFNKTLNFLLKNNIITKELTEI